jgi:hypothetical protein
MQQMRSGLEPFFVDKEYGNYVPGDYGVSGNTATIVDFAQSKHFDKNVVAITKLKNALADHGFEKCLGGRARYPPIWAHRERHLQPQSV